MNPQTTPQPNREARRAELLRITPNEDPDDVTHFHGLTVAVLEQLVTEGFAQPDNRQNKAPSTGEFLKFMHAWPEAHAFGYVVSFKREDARVAIEGCAAALEKVAEARRAPLAEAFRAAFQQSADEYVEAVGVLYAWWD